MVSWCEFSWDDYGFGWICTLRSGHDGDHEAGDSNHAAGGVGIVYSTRPRDADLLSALASVLPDRLVDMLVESAAGVILGHRQLVETLERVAREQSDLDVGRGGGMIGISDEERAMLRTWACATRTGGEVAVDIMEVFV